MEGLPLDPNRGGIWSWWIRTCPESWRIFGEPVLFDEPNLDFLSATLNESPPGVIFYPEEEQFYYKDYVFEGAYRPASDARVEAFFKKLIIESLEDAQKSSKEGSKTLFQSAGLVRERGKVILAVEGDYFTGEEGHRRWIEGRYVEPVEKFSVAMFAETKITRKRGSILPTGEAYSRYFDFCRVSGLEPVKKTVFRERFANEVRRRWGQGVRNDLKVDGSSHQGWSELAIL
jgi:hypothetical protein